MVGKLRLLRVSDLDRIVVAAPSDRKGRSRRARQPMARAGSHSLGS